MPTLNPVTIVNGSGSASVLNSTQTALAGGATFTGVAELGDGTDVMVSCKTDADGTLYVDLSVDGTNWDTQIPFTVTAGVGEFHCLVKGPRTVRVRFVNGSAAQTYLRLLVAYGEFRQPNSGLNSSVQPDADAITARVIGEETFTAESKYTGRSLVNKFGRNSDIDTASVPEDVWGGGSTYTGFPTGAAETIQAVSTDAGDTGTLTVTYLASSTATDYATASVALQGTTPVSLGVTGTRVHTASYSSGSATAMNLGAITIRQTPTTANIFAVMRIGASQTNESAYTVPTGHTAYLKRLFCRVIGSAAGQVDGALWVRTNGGSPRLRRPFTAASTAPMEERPYGGLTFAAGSDMVIRINSASANNLDVTAGYDVVLVKN